MQASYIKSYDNLSKKQGKLNLSEANQYFDRLIQKCKSINDKVYIDMANNSLYIAFWEQNKLGLFEIMIVID